MKGSLTHRARSRLCPTLYRQAHDEAKRAIVVIELLELNADSSKLRTIGKRFNYSFPYEDSCVVAIGMYPLHLREENWLNVALDNVPFQWFCRANLGPDRSSFGGEHLPHIFPD